MYFYPRPPRGGRHEQAAKSAKNYLFLSTPSARRATSVGTAEAAKIFISIHALREEGDVGQVGVLGLALQFLSTPSARRATAAAPRTAARISISIHALREEGDEFSLPVCVDVEEFLSTPSARRATLSQARYPLAISISIHALREEGDSKNRDKISIFKQIIQHSARI